MGVVMAEGERASFNSSFAPDTDATLGPADHL